MTNEYSAHPALASEQLQRAELSTAQTHHRRHNSAGAAAAVLAYSGSAAAAAVNDAGSPTKLKSSTNKSAKTTTTTTIANTEVLGSTAKFTTAAAAAPTQKTLPDRTVLDASDGNVVLNGNAEDYNNTKDCVDCAPSSASHSQPVDETDHNVLQRFSRTHHTAAAANTPNDDCSRPHFMHDAYDDMTNAADGCVSGLSSAISSPSPSTVCSPLSTPTRLAPHHFHHSHHQQQCCQKTTGARGMPPCTSTHHTHHTPTHHAAPLTPANAAAGGCKKFDPRLGPSPYRQLLPIALCILSFATVFSILIVYMDTTEIRHQQFRLNMSRDYDLYGVAQDDPQLIAFLREIHMRKYPMHFLKNRDDTPGATVGGVSSGTAFNFAEQHLNFSAGHYHGDLAPEMAHYVAELVGGKMNGAVIQSLPGTLGQLMTAPWLAETLNWAGVIVEPEPRRYFTLRKQNAQRAHMQVVHACVSPQQYPKEVTIHNEESEVRINSLLDEETSWFNSRVKCFPLYTIMLACNRVEYDLLSLGVHGHELEILKTLPFDKIKIEVISIHLHDEHDNVRGYIQSITKFLTGKSYKLQKKFGRNYFYQRINSTSRTRKKDILLLKTP